MKRSTLVIIGLVVVVGGIAYVQYRNALASKGPTVVKIEPIAARDLYAVVLASGKVDAKSRADVSSEVTGRILKIHVREGDNVTKGQLLVELDTTTYSSRVQQVEQQIVAGTAQLTQNKNNVDQAKANLDRKKALQKTAPGGVTTEEIETLTQAYENAKASYASSEAQLQQTRASLKEAKDNLGRTKLYAPISGKVVKLAREEGEVAQPGTFSADVGMVMRIADLSVILAKVKVDETNIARLHLNDSVSVSIDAFPDTTFVGRVTKIANSASSAAAGATDASVSFEVEVTISNPPKDVRPDLSMTARIVTDAKKNVISVPIIAMTSRSDADLPNELKQGTVEVKTKAPGDTGAKAKPKEQEGVFVVNGGLARFRLVKVGITGDEYFEVLSGLKPGDSVVSGSYQAIRNMKDSTKVKADSIMNGMKMGVKKP